MNSLPAPGLLLHSDASAMGFDDPLDETQAEARALNASFDRLAAAVERLEDTCLV